MSHLDGVCTYASALVGRALVGPPGPLSATVGPSGFPWAFVDQALVSTPGPLFAPLCYCGLPWALVCETAHISLTLWPMTCIYSYMFFLFLYMRLYCCQNDVCTCYWGA